MPLNNSYIVQSTVSKKFLNELHQKLQELNIQGMHIQGIDTHLPVHMTLGLAVNRQKTSNMQSLNQDLIKEITKIMQNYNSFFMLPEKIELTGNGHVLLVFEKIDMEQNPDIRQFHQDIINIFIKHGLKYNSYSLENFLPHITIGKVIQGYDQQQIKDSIEKEKVIEKLKFSIRPLNLYDIRVEHTIDANNSNILLKKNLPYRDYAIKHVNEDNNGNFIITLKDEAKSKECVSFLYSFGITKRNNPSEAKQINKTSNKEFTILLERKQYDAMAGIINGLKPKK